MHEKRTHPKHSSHEQIPDKIHIVTLPPYSPVSRPQVDKTGLQSRTGPLNPIEKLLDLIQDQIANKLRPTIESLDKVVVN